MISEVQPDDRLLKLIASRTEAARALDVSENHVKNLVRRGELCEVRLGRRRGITVKSIQELVERGGTRAA